jgi:hypothetical protein
MHARRDLLPVRFCLRSSSSPGKPAPKRHASLPGTERALLIDASIPRGNEAVEQVTFSPGDPSGQRGSACDVL